MSEATPPPDPRAGGDPADPTAPPSPAAWTPPDPLAAPQAWPPAAPWPTAPPAPPGAAGGAGTPVPNRPAVPPAAIPPAGPAAPGSAPPPPPGHPWPGYGTPSWPPAGYPPPYAHPGATPPARNSPVAVIVITVVTVLALVVCGCAGLAAVSSWVDDQPTSSEPFNPGYEPWTGGTEEDGTPRPATTPSGGPGRYEVVYEVTGTGPVEIQFYDADANFLQVTGVRSPWRLAFTANDRERVQIIASPGDLSDGKPVTCQITMDGKVVSTDSGVYGAVCFGW